MKVVLEYLNMRPIKTRRAQQQALYGDQGSINLRSGEDQVPDDHLVALLDGQKQRRQLIVGVLGPERQRMRGWP